MIVKESGAKDKTCCKDSCSAIRCMGSRCMAWRWVSPPVLERTNILGSADVERITGERQPQPEGNPDYSAQFDDFMQRALKHKNVIARLTFAGNFAGWKQDGDPEYDPEDCVLYAHQNRNFDPEAAGYCGMAGKPDELNGAK